MLLTSPGDNSSSLPIDSLPPLPPDGSLDSQSGIEGDRVTATAPLEAFVESYRKPSQRQNHSASDGRPHAEAAPPLSIPTVKTAHSGTQQPLRQAEWTKSPFQEHDLDGLYGLREAATLKTLRQSRTRSWNSPYLTELADVGIAESIDVLSFAAPLSPLRERDLTALSKFFLRDDMLAIEADINQRLLSLLPEPCWEDGVFDFLKEFL